MLYNSIYLQFIEQYPQVVPSTFVYTIAEILYFVLNIAPLKKDVSQGLFLNYKLVYVFRKEKHKNLNKQQPNINLFL